MPSGSGGPGISPALRRTVEDLGGDAQRWLAGVSARVSELAVAWNLEVGAPLAHGGSASIILPVTTCRGEAAVLKLAVPHQEARPEAEALARWGGDGAVTLLRSSADGFALLLERCDPGRDLWTAPIEEQVDVLADLLPRLWLPEPDGPFPELDRTVAGWGRHLAALAAALGLPEQLAARGRRWVAELAGHQPRRLLHGDLHPGNVLAAERAPWLAIDPKPLVGDPAFDLAQLLLNWATVVLGVPGATQDDAVEVIVSRTIALADRLALDHDRVLRWAVIKAIGWGYGREETLLLDRALTV